MKSEFQVQLETALLGDLKTLCRVLKGYYVELGSVQMQNCLVIAKHYWMNGARWVMTEVVAEADSISLEEVKAVIDED